MQKSKRQGVGRWKVQSDILGRRFGQAVPKNPHSETDISDTLKGNAGIYILQGVGRKKIELRVGRNRK